MLLFKQPLPCFYITKYDFIFLPSLSASVTNKTRAANNWDLVQADQSWEDVMLGEANEVVASGPPISEIPQGFPSSISRFRFSLFCLKADEPL